MKFIGLDVSLLYQAAFSWTQESGLLIGNTGISGAPCVFSLRLKIRGPIIEEKILTLILND